MISESLSLCGGSAFQFFSFSEPFSLRLFSILISLKKITPKSAARLFASAEFYCYELNFITNSGCPVCLSICSCSISALRLQEKTIKIYKDFGSLFWMRRTAGQSACFCFYLRPGLKDGRFYASCLPAPGPGETPKISSIFRITAPLDLRGNPILLPSSSIHRAVSSYRSPEVSIVTVPFS